MDLHGLKSYYVIVIVNILQPIYSFKLSKLMENTYKEKTQVSFDLDPFGVTQRLRRRSVDPLDVNVFHAHFTVARMSVKLNLTRNVDITTSIPVYVWRNGVLYRIISDTSEGTGLYQDLQTGSSILLKCPFQGRCEMFGSFYLNSKVYFIEPDEDLKHELPELLSQRSNSWQSGLLNTVVNHVVFHARPDTSSYGDYILLEQENLMANNAETSRHARAVGHYHVEVLIVYDYAAYMYWYNRTTASEPLKKIDEARSLIRRNSAFLINGMDLRYESTSTYGTKINILFKGVVIAELANDANWTEGIKTSNQIDASSALRNFKEWVIATSLPDHDHAMLLTGYDLTGVGSNAIAGLAYLGTICSPSSQSIVQNGFDSMFVTLAAHELGHGLGAQHDGTNNNCTGANGYIMAAGTSFNNINQWIFSRCSVVEYFQPHIAKLVASFGDANCLSVISADYNATALSPYDQNWMGQVYTVDEQCALQFGKSSYMCRTAYANRNFTSICTAMACKSVTGCGGMIPGEKTPCASQMWCDKGQCVPSSDVPADCIFGDQPGVITNNLTCADIANKPSEMYRCYSTNLQCCSSCLSISTGVTGCEYGNKVTWCNTVTLRRQCYTYASSCCVVCFPKRSNITGCEYGDRVAGCTLASCVNNSVNCCETCYVSPTIVTIPQTKVTTTTTTTITTRPLILTSATNQSVTLSISLNLTEEPVTTEFLKIFNPTSNSPSNNPITTPLTSTKMVTSLAITKSPAITTATYLTSSSEIKSASFLMTQVMQATSLTTTPSTTLRITPTSIVATISNFSTSSANSATFSESTNLSDSTSATTSTNQASIPLTSTSVLKTSAAMTVTSITSTSAIPTNSCTITPSRSQTPRSTQITHLTMISSTSISESVSPLHMTSIITSLLTNATASSTIPMTIDFTTTSDQASKSKTSALTTTPVTSATLLSNVVSSQSLTSTATYSNTSSPGTSTIPLNTPVFLETTSTVSPLTMTSNSLKLSTDEMNASTTSPSITKFTKLQNQTTVQTSKTTINFSTILTLIQTTATTKATKESSASLVTPTVNTMVSPSVKITKSTSLFEAKTLVTINVASFSSSPSSLMTQSATVSTVKDENAAGTSYMQQLILIVSGGGTSVFILILFITFSCIIFIKKGRYKRHSEYLSSSEDSNNPYSTSCSKLTYFRTDKTETTFTNAISCNPPPPDIWSYDKLPHVYNLRWLNEHEESSLQDNFFI